MTVSSRTPRPIDHLVLPVSELALARDRLTALGFTVAKDARHPFGTENCCVFLADGSYLEPLGIANREECEAAAREGNAFVARDQAFRFRRGLDGFSGIAMATGDAFEDDRRYAAAGLSGGEVLEFSRDMLLPDGTKATGSFRLAFAADLRSPDFFFFASQRVVALPSDRKALEAHENGVVALAEVVLSEQNPTDFQYLVQEAADEREVEALSFGMTVETPRGRITVLNDAGLEGFYGIAPVAGADRGLKGQAVVFKVSSLSDCRRLLTERGVAFRERDNRLLVPPAPGQGVLFVFGE
ncbi:VOC family protein [Shinella zoogloeoides]|uniref:VOC family protein n=1 Tax=Shinella zoogloeoides TaxID=352475 RepID=UPI001F58229B|nr:VOC family protein [Shinella zoogloeoides]